MKTRYLIPVVALLAIGGTAAVAQTQSQSSAPPFPGGQQMEQRFQDMSKVMGQAMSAHGAKLTELMQEHMKLMQEQMQSMHAMMGGGAMGGTGMMGGNAQGGPGGANALAQMQARMDVMQQMMEQMLGQQQMMTPTLHNSK